MEQEKQIQRRQRYGDAMLRRARKYRALIITAVHALLKRDTPSLAREAFEVVYDARVARFQAAHERFAQAATARDLERGEDGQTALALGGTVEALAERLRAARERCAQVLGREVVAQYHLAGRTPTQPTTLRDAVTRVLEALRKQPREQEDIFGATFSTRSIVDLLEPLHQALIAAIDAHGDEGEETAAAQVAFTRARDTWEQASRSFAAVLIADLRDAGLDEEADRIKPTEQRLRGEDAVDDQPDPLAAREDAGVTSDTVVDLPAVQSE